MFKLSSVFLLLVLAACSSFTGSRSQQKTFNLSNVWVWQTTKETQSKFRKINRMSPVLFQDLVIQANALDGITAVRRSDFSTVWKLDVVNGVEGGATLEQRKLYFGASDGLIYKVDAASGRIDWSYPANAETLSEPLIANGSAFVLTGNNVLLALDTETGKLRWSYSRIDSSNLSVRGGSKPAIKNNNLFVGFSDGAVVSLNAQTGAVNWEKLLNRNKRFKDIDSNPVVENDLLYLLGFDDALYCLKASSGDVVWKHSKGGYGSVLLTKDRLLYSTTTEEVLSLDKVSGQVMWSYKLSDGIATSPVLYKGMIVFGESKGALVLLDSGSGKKVSEFYPGRGIFSPPTVDEVSQEIYFISNEANLYKMRTQWSQRVTY